MSADFDSRKIRGREEADLKTHRPLVSETERMFPCRKMPIKEINLQKVLTELNFTQREFIDLCILLGCDYCGSIKGVGPKRAVELMKANRSIEKVLSSLDTKVSEAKRLSRNITFGVCDITDFITWISPSQKYPPPEDWQYERARELFEKPDVTPGDDLEFKWKEPDEEGLVKFLCEENGFNEERIR